MAEGGIQKPCLGLMLHMNGCIIFSWPLSKDMLSEVKQSSRKASESRHLWRGHGVSCEPRCSVSCTGEAHMESLRNQGQLSLAYPLLSGEVSSVHWGWAPLSPVSLCLDHSPPSVLPSFSKASSICISVD